MQGFAKRGLALVAATSGLVMATAGIASAQASATGGTDHSRGVASGNSLNTPVSVPLNVCGNQVTAISVVERTHGQYCKIGGGQGATAHGGTHRSGGILSGNSLNTAVSVPLNLCGNQVGAIGAGNSVGGSDCEIG
jgi:ChpA-C